MTYEQFLLEMDEILGIAPGTIRGNEKLDELKNWDSTALVSFLALAESTGGSASLEQIANCATVEDLVRLSRVGVTHRTAPPRSGIA